MGTIVHNQEMKQQLHFVTGKGGVGKSTVAASLALHLSKTGARVLLVELGDQSFYKDFFGLADVDYYPRPLCEGVDIALWSGEQSLREYARYLIKVEALTHLFFENTVMRTFLNVAPALQELAILGKITSGIRHHGPPLIYDVIVIDAYATGHFLALLEAPSSMSRAISVGPMGEQSRSIDSIIKNPEYTHFHIVTLPEELPIKEATELFQQIKDRTHQEAHIYLNKVLEVPVSDIVLKNEKHVFSKFIQYQKNQTDEFYKICLDCSPQVQKIPLVLTHDAWKIIQQIEQRIT